jgi:hypothetical protein
LVTLNRQVFAKDPTGFTIPNDGVARVGIPANAQEWQTLRWELESFVCEGEYRTGLDRILSTYLSRLNQPKQPAVWVSGFYGSGKSHLVRVLDALWRDLVFPDGASARGLVQLPTEISEHVVELSAAARREGGLWSAAGTLSTGIGASVRLAILRFVFRSAGLPEDYVKGRFVLWLRKEGYLAAVEDALGKSGRSLTGELTNMHMSESLASALLAAAPGLATSTADVLKLLRVEYPTNVTEIGGDDFVASLLAVLAEQSSTPGRLPLVLIVLDELQQFLAEDPKRTLEVQDIVERCSSELEGRLLFLATGQMQLGATPALQKLRDRFTVQVALSDSDVDRVVRAVVLRKDPTRSQEVARVLEHASGEVNRQLGGTKIGARGADTQDLVPDYPLLPARRRFWEAILRSVDSAGKAGQLRAQLRIVLEATQGVANSPLGTVIPADAMYDPILADLQQSGVLPRDTATLIAGLEPSSGGDQLKARIAKLAFLIARLEEAGPLATGVRATPDMLADLLIDDLVGGGVDTRRRVPEAIKDMVSDGVLLEVDGQYLLQTPVAAEWLQAFQHEATRLRNDDQWLADRRSRAIRTAIGDQIGKTTLSHGKSKIPRKLTLSFGDSVPGSSAGDVPVWIRDGWSTTLNTVQDDARAAGTDSPVLFVFVPRLDADGIRDALSAEGAADNVVHGQPTPQTEEGMQAQSGIASKGKAAVGRLALSMGNLMTQARVFQGGGNEVTGDSLQAAVDTAAKAALTRLFPRFADGDDPGWGKVKDRAQQGSANPLGALNWGSEPDKHPACAEILRFLAAGQRTGKDIRIHFQGSEYGWPQDTADGALYALVASGLLRARLNGSPVTAKAIPQNSIGTVVFQTETVVVSSTVRIEVKGLATKIGSPVAGIPDADIPARIVQRLLELASDAGGQAPLPPAPSPEIVRDLQGLTGNELTLRLFEIKDELLSSAATWKDQAGRKVARFATWTDLNELLRFADDGETKAQATRKADAILKDRSLLADPDPVSPLVTELTSVLRERFTASRNAYEIALKAALAALDTDSLWQQLKESQRNAIIGDCGLDGRATPGLETSGKLLEALRMTPPSQWESQSDALQARLLKARDKAARLMEPTAVRVTPPPATIRTEAELEAYLSDLRAKIQAQLAKGPVVL